jgi:tRNA pseudouridine13 synthase
MSKRALPQQSSNKKPRLSTKVLMEHSVGISEYIEKGVELSAIIKHRFQDFHVHEISKGNIVFLKELKVLESAVPESCLSDSEKCQEIAAIVSDADLASKVMELLEKKEGSLTSAPIAEKDTRSLFHKKVREHFGSLLDTKTEGESIVISIVKNGDKRRGKSWKELGGEFCHFTLHKENRDTMDAISVLAKLLR